MLLGLGRLAGVLGPLAGCGGAEPYSVTTSAVPGATLLTAPDAHQTRLLSNAYQAEALAAMTSIAQGGEIVNRPGPAVYGKDWNDIPSAVGTACGKVGIEMVVVYKTETNDPDTKESIGLRFFLRTVEDWPGVFEVRRVQGPQVYEVVECAIGRFPDMAHSVRRRDDFLAEFEKQLLLWGKKNKFRD